MSIFNNLGTEGLEQQKDALGGGYQPLETGIYPAKIKTVYVTFSKGGAMAANLVADIEGREYREQLWITNKNGQNFFVNKTTGNKVPLPGFTQLNDLCLCAIGKELNQLDTEDRIFKIYDMEAKAEVNKPVPTIVDLMDGEVYFAITKNLVDKTIKDASGNYVPSGETKEENTIAKVFHAGTKMTVNEAKSGLKEGGFFEKWHTKNAGKVMDKTTKDKGTKQATAGAPQKPATKSLFG